MAVASSGFGSRNVSPEAIDGQCRLLWRMNPRRMEIEAFRDSILRAAGTLDETIYGPSHYKKQVLKPLQDEGFVEAVAGQRRRGTFPDGTILRFKAGA